MDDLMVQAENPSFLDKVLRAARAIGRTSLSTYRITRAACEYGHGVDQRWVELTGLAHLVRELNPMAGMEIGLGSGGTLALWAQLSPAKATIIGVDLTLPEGIEEYIRIKMKAGQNLQLLQGNSHSSETKEQALDVLGNNRLDFLFIDGDHSYEGVKQDFEDYSPLVRPGGIVALHDIVPDYSVRFGVKTERYAGGVSEFWREISSHFPHYEFIESIGQDGCGIGVLRF